MFQTKGPCTIQVKTEYFTEDRTLNFIFSCTGSHPDARRICPCRDTSKQDISLCSTCFVGITHSQHKSQQQSQQSDGHGHGH